VTGHAVAIERRAIGRWSGSRGSRGRRLLRFSGAKNGRCQATERNTRSDEAASAEPSGLQRPIP
jgi:hypothetical protein